MPTVSAQVIYYLSGLTCTDENFTQKAGAQRKAAELGVALVAPDTSPRGLGIEGEDDRCGSMRALPRLPCHSACPVGCDALAFGRVGCEQIHRLWHQAASCHPRSCSAHVVQPRSWDFGTGAGFYLDATAPKWQRYRMYSYITRELPAVIAATAPELDLGNVRVHAVCCVCLRWVWTCVGCLV